MKSGSHRFLRSRLGSGGSRKGVNYFQNGIGARANENAVREILPLDGSGSIHKEFGGPRDVLPIRACVGMQHAVAADDVRFGIGEERESVTAVRAKAARLRVRIDAYGEDLDAARAKLVQTLLKAP